MNQVERTIVEGLTSPPKRTVASMRVGEVGFVSAKAICVTKPSNGSEQSGLGMLMTNQLVYGTWGDRSCAILRDQDTPEGVKVFRGWGPRGLKYRDDVEDSEQIEGIMFTFIPS